MLYTKGTTRKYRSTFALTPNKYVASKLILENILLLTNISILFAALDHRTALLSNFLVARIFIQCSQISLNIIEHLINIESHVFNARISNDEYSIFLTSLINFRINNFANDDQVKIWIRYKKGKL